MPRIVLTPLEGASQPPQSFRKFRSFPSFSVVCQPGQCQSWQKRQPSFHAHARTISHGKGGVSARSSAPVMTSKATFSEVERYSTATSNEQQVGNSPRVYPPHSSFLDDNAQQLATKRNPSSGVLNLPHLSKRTPVITGCSIGHEKATRSNQRNV